MIQMECFLHILLAKIQIANEIYLRRTKKNTKIIHFCHFFAKDTKCRAPPPPLEQKPDAPHH